MILAEGVRLPEHHQHGVDDRREAEPAVDADEEGAAERHAPLAGRLGLRLPPAARGVDLAAHLDGHDVVAALLPAAGHGGPAADGVVELPEERKAEIVRLPHEDQQPGGGDEYHRADEGVELPKDLGLLAFHRQKARHVREEEVDPADGVPHGDPPDGVPTRAPVAHDGLLGLATRVRAQAAAEDAIEDAVVEHLADPTDDEAHAAREARNRDEQVLGQPRQVENREDDPEGEDRRPDEVSHGANPRGHLRVVPPHLCPIRDEVLDGLVRLLPHVDEVQIGAISAREEHHAADKVWPQGQHRHGVLVPMQRLLKELNGRGEGEEKGALHEQHGRPVGRRVVPHELAVRGVVLIERGGVGGHPAK
mmetsp:Transcript_69953/g.216270  ORF Transcript_69953/g.216270 Transcript_69953/m.216270 type:complete len:364 (-) Transcript_69953:94-1185(-)